MPVLLWILQATLALLCFAGGAYKTFHELVVSLLPGEPEARGMLALMLYAEARRPARRDVAGAFVPLAEQDTGRWIHRLIEWAEALLHDANAGGPGGRYQLEAAIQSAHMAQRVSGRDTRRAIVALYDHLFALTASPVAALNRAAAIAAVDGAAAGLDALAPLAADQCDLSTRTFAPCEGHVPPTGDRMRGTV